MANWTWRTPVTDRTSGADRMRYTDMIRITENINYIIESAQNKGYVVYVEELSKTTWTHDDIITRSQWNEILNSLLGVARSIYYEYEDEPNFEMTFININIVEELTLKCKNIIDQSIDMSRLNHYVGDDIFAKDSVNAGGSY